MKNKKGFTLIELLAVIVILAIIMVIAVPQILNIIEHSRENATNNSIKMLKSAIKTQIASRELTQDQFVKNLEGCYEFDFDDDENGNVEKLKVKNKDRFSGQIKSCNGVLTETNLVFDASTSGTTQKEKKYYIYNKGTNNGLDTRATSVTCGNTHTYTFNASNVSVVYTDQKTGCTGWADFHTTSDIDFSKYTKAVVVFESLTITGEGKATLVTPDDTGWTNYVWFTESKTNETKNSSTKKTTNKNMFIKTYSLLKLLIKPLLLHQY